MPKAGPGRPPIGKTAMTGAERSRKYRLQHPPSPKVKPGDAEVATLAAELEAAQKRIFELEHEHILVRHRAIMDEIKLRGEFARELKREAQAKAAALSPAKTEAKFERQITDLKEKLGVARTELRVVRNWAKRTGIPEKGGMNRSTYGTIAKVLHPDASPSEADRAAACRVFNAWVDSLKAARG